MTDASPILSIDAIIALFDQPRGGHAASREFDRRVPKSRQPCWAARIVERFQPRYPRLAEIDAIVAIAHDPRRWSEAPAAFGALRQRTLEMEKAQDRSSYGFLVLAEDLAKTTANVDPDAEGGSFKPARGLVLAMSARTLAREADDVELVHDIETLVQRRD